MDRRHNVLHCVSQGMQLIDTIRHSMQAEIYMVRLFRHEMPFKTAELVSFSQIRDDKSKIGTEQKAKP